VDEICHFAGDGFCLFETKVDRLKQSDGFIQLSRKIFFHSRFDGQHYWHRASSEVLSERSVLRGKLGKLGLVTCRKLCCAALLR